MNGIERLEEIKSRVWKDKGTYAMGDYSQREGYIYTLSDYDYEWLIEQAKRVQELEKENKRLEDFIETIQNVHFVELQREKAENRRYREALELLVKQETLGKDAKTGKTAVSPSGMVALKGLGIFDDNDYTVYGVDEVIESVLEELE